MRRRVTRTVVALVGLLAVAITTGCMNVPTRGAIERVEGVETSCENCVNVEVAPPTAGAEPLEIVEGYLRANSNYQPNYSVARQFLSRSAAEKWAPEGPVQIYRASPVADGDNVTIEGLLVGSLERDRTYTPLSQTLSRDLGLVKEDGEWRIGNPLPGLMVAEYSFDNFYQSYNVYFVGNENLVPDPIYLPRLRNPANVASALMKALLVGPSDWLAPAVSTAIPENTTLSVDSVPITDGIAEVPLSDTVLAMSEVKRTQMAAQVVYTLKQLVGVKGVKFSVNQKPFGVPESDPDTLVVPVTAISTELDPIPFVAAEQLYVVAENRAIQRVSDNADQSSRSPLPGPLGSGQIAVDSLAVSVANTDVVAVTDDRTILRRGPTANGAPGSVDTLLTGVTDLLRPQFSRYGEVWAVGRKSGEQQLWMFTAARTRIDVDAAKVLAGGNIKAFKISPDGTRMAMIRTTAEGAELGVARISRSVQDRVTVDGWRTLDIQTRKPVVKQMADLGWLNATQLVVLGSADTDAAYGPVQINQDASDISAENQTNEWDAVGLTVLLRTQTTVIVGADQQTYKDDGNRWQPYLDKVLSAAYPG